MGGGVGGVGVGGVGGGGGGAGGGGGGGWGGGGGGGEREGEKERRDMREVHEIVKFLQPHSVMKPCVICDAQVHLSGLCLSRDPLTKHMHNLLHTKHKHSESLAVMQPHSHLQRGSMPHKACEDPAAFHSCPSAGAKNAGTWKCI